MRRLIADTGTVHRNRAVAEQDLALNRMDAEERGQELPLTLALQSAQAEDLAAMQIEADIMKALAGAEIADGEDDRRRKHLSRSAASEGRFAASARPTMSCTRSVVVVPDGGNGGDVLAILEHRDAVGDGEDLLQTVGDEDDRRPLVAQSDARARRGARPDRCRGPRSPHPG